METTATTQRSSAIQPKFIFGALLILAAVIYLIVSSTRANAQYFLTVEELAARGDEVLGRQLRVSGAVIGETVVYDADTLTLTFTVAHVPGDNKAIEQEGGLARALEIAVQDPDRARLPVVYTAGPKPDLLRHQAQAIMTGRLGEDGVFYADELLLKCPTRYDEALPGQGQG